MLTFELAPETANDGWTQSEITTMDDCGQMWYWRYDQRLRKKGEFSWALVVGSCVHATLEQMYATKGARWSIPALIYPEGTILTPTQMEKETYWVMVIQAMMTAYAQHYQSDFERFVVDEIEEKVEVRFMGFIFRGMIDLRYRPQANDGLWIMDHKTTSRLNLQVTGSWDFRFQFMFYLWLKWKANPDGAPRGYVTNGIKKPELRQGKKETVEEFAERVRVDMVHEPQKYFYREKMPMATDAMMNFETNVLAPKIYRLQMLQGKDGPVPAATVAHNMNTNHCQAYGRPCEYIDLCRFGRDKMGFLYEQRGAKHEELEEAEG